jgi:putative DNA primase/helicase
MPIQTDMAILRAIVDCVISAPEMTRPVIPERATPAARGRARRKSRLGEASISPAGEATHVPSADVGAPIESATQTPPPTSARAIGQGELDARLAFFPLTDLGNAERFRERNRGRLIYCSVIGWLWWDKRRWQRDGADEKVMEAVHRIVRAIQDEAKALKGTPNDKVIGTKGGNDIFLSDRLREWGRTSEANGRLTPIAVQARAYLAVLPAQLDADPMTINVENGTLVINRDAPGYVRLKPHDPADLITKLAPVYYDPDATCPLYDGFLAKVQPTAEARRFLHQWGGFSLTGDASEHKLVFFWGEGRNGKSTLLNAWKSVAGDYSHTVPIETFLFQGRGRNAGQATPDLAKLPGVRMLRTSEPPRGAKFDEALLKLLTGGEPFSVRHLNREYFDLHPQFKLTISTNYPPKIGGTDEGIWGRVRMVPWQVILPEDEQDKKLGEKLQHETSGILNRLLDGLRDWLDDGLVMPASVIELTQERRRESDALGRFLEICVIRSSADKVKATAMHEAFCGWARENGATPWKPRGLSDALLERGYKKKHSDGRWWLEVKLTTEGEQFADEERRVRALHEQRIRGAYGAPADAADDGDFGI